MKKITWLLIFCCFPLFALEYNINVSLDTNKKILSGKEQISWKNNFNVPINIIPLHLYMNGFSGTDTVFMRESGGKHRRSKLNLSAEKSYGYCKVKKVLINGKEENGKFDYLPKIENYNQYGLFDESEVSNFVKPDNTIGLIILTKPVNPGETINLEIEFETKFPRIFARTGYYKNYFFAGQWFPKIAVFQGDSGWNCHFFHLNSEFFADFGNFSVTVTIPDNYIIGATGILKSEKKENGKKIVNFKAENVHDFAFTTWDKYKVAKDKWKNVDLTLLYQPGNEGTVERQLNALKGAMDSYSYLCGFDYPYSAFTLVDVPAKAAGAGGMEYPMLVTGISMVPYMPEGIKFAESVIVHEFGHNYFYGMLASNEFEDAWMDEGLNSFATSFAMERQYKYMIDLPFLKVKPFDTDSMGNSNYDGLDFPGKASWNFASNGSYSTNSYSKTSIYLKTLQNILGEEKFLAVFREYFDRFKFTHPRPSDFLNVVKEVGGDVAYDFMNRAIYSTDKIDFAIMKLKSTKKKKHKGYVDFKIIKDKKKNNDKKEKQDKKKEVFENTLYVANYGDFIFPVKIKVQFENNDTKELNWDGKGDWKKFEFESNSKIKMAIIDPEKIYHCDVDPENNAKVLSKNKKPYIKLSIFFTTFVQAIFSRLLMML